MATKQTIERLYKNGQIISEESVEIQTDNSLEERLQILEEDNNKHKNEISKLWNRKVDKDNVGP